MNYSLKYDSNLVAVEVIPFYWSIYLFMSHTYHSYGVSHTLWLMIFFLFWPNPFLFVQVRTAVTKDNDNSPFKIIFRWLTILRNTFGVAFRAVIQQKLRPEFERFSKNGRKLGKKEPFFKFLFLFLTTRGLRKYIFGIFWKKKNFGQCGDRTRGRLKWTELSIKQTNEPETEVIYKDHWFPTAEIPWQPIHKQSWECVYQ